MKKRVIFLPADFAGCGQFRMIQPAKDLKQMNTEDLEFELVHDKVSNNTNFGTLVSLLKDYDAVVFQRVASPKILGIMKEVKKMGKKVYMDIDDALLHVSKSNPAYRVWNPKSDAWTTLKEALKLCDKIFFSTPQLSEVYAIGNCAVFFNGLNLQDPIYLPERNRYNDMPRNRKIIGWAGSSSHLESLREITKPIKKLISQRDDVSFALCSNPEFLQLFDIPKDRKLYVQHKPFEEWPPVMSMFDVSLAPIVTGIFNSCKSELKVLEAGVWGVPSVCTMEAPYKRFHELSGGGNALVYRNDVNEWVRKISAALDDSEKREEMVLKTKNTIESVYNLREINKKRVNFFREELF
jgi:glycosyltransferase involved in cell wall biosynthesis